MVDWLGRSSAGHVIVCFRLENVTIRVGGDDRNPIWGFAGYSGCWRAAEALDGLRTRWSRDLRSRNSVW